MDVEARSQTGNGSVNNPYSSSSSVTNVLPTWHPINVLRKCLYMGGSLYGLNYFDAYNTLMKSPNVSHEWFKLGLAASIGFLFLKIYVELYIGKVKKQKVNYEEFPQETHGAILFLLLASVGFNVALWPAYGGNAMIVMLLVGMFLLNFCLLFPTWLQNLVGIILLTLFLQEYK